MQREGPSVGDVITSTDSSSSVRGPIEGFDDKVVEGPWGSNEETTFYDGDGDITEIEVAFNKQYIVRIQTTFILNGRTFKQAPRGGPSGDVSKVSNLWGTPFCGFDDLVVWLLARWMLWGDKF